MVDGRGGGRGRRGSHDRTGGGRERGAVVDGGCGDDAERQRSFWIAGGTEEGRCCEAWGW